VTRKEAARRAAEMVQEFQEVYADEVEYVVGALEGEEYVCGVWLSLLACLFVVCFLFLFGE
jgi:hypothetical protein